MVTILNFTFQGNFEIREDFHDLKFLPVTIFSVKHCDSNSNKENEKAGLIYTCINELLNKKMSRYQSLK